MLITKKLIVAINGLETPASPPDGGKHILLYTPTGEFHEIPLLYMRYLMKKNGVSTIYFGSNVAVGTFGIIAIVVPSPISIFIW